MGLAWTIDCKIVRERERDTHTHTHTERNRTETEMNVVSGGGEEEAKKGLEGVGIPISCQFPWKPPKRSERSASPRDSSPS